MLHVILFLLLPFLCPTDNNLDPVKWSYQLEENADSTFVVFTADIDKNWVVYSQYTDADGPVPTRFTFGTNECFQLEGPVEELSDMIVEQSDLFGVEVKKFKEKSIFKQRITKNCEGVLNCTVLFMTCDGEACLPPKRLTFEIEIN